MAKHLGAGTAGALKVVVRPAVTFAAQHYGAPPELADVAGEAAAAAAAMASGESGASDGTAEAAASTIESVTDFQREFGRLLDDLKQASGEGKKPFQAVVVFIDDLDRCMDDTVIYVFEAIRLFLQVSSTAFILAANRDIVQAAIDRRYPAAREGDPALGKDYLEKIIQVEVTVPPLSEPEAETYLSLLFAELRLGVDDFDRLRATAQARRVDGQFAVAMNYGIAKDALGSIGPELEADFAIVNRIAPTLSRGLRGNPRQLKRFLNTLLLRLETAKRRDATLDPAILARLMVLEIVAPKEFQQLFDWQLAQDGIPEELAAAEQAARADTGLSDGSSNELAAWFGAKAVQKWLKLDPELSNVALGQYFFFSRDRLSPSAPAARLTAPLQALLGRLQSPVPAQRRPAVDLAAGLPSEEYSQLYAVLLERAVRQPEAKAMDSILELTARVPAELADADRGAGRRAGYQYPDITATTTAHRRKGPGRGPSSPRPVGGVRQREAEEGRRCGEKDSWLRWAPQPTTRAGPEAAGQPSSAMRRSSPSVAGRRDSRRHSVVSSQPWAAWQGRQRRRALVCGLGSRSGPSSQPQLGRRVWSAVSKPSACLPWSDKIDSPY